MHKGELANINPPRITTEPLHPKDKDVLKKEKANKLVINLLAF